jgi:pimeloyl-ACP methyl ester carboxylesterase
LAPRPGILENAPKALLRLLSGENFGRQLVKLPMQLPRPESTMTIHTHQTAPTQFVEAKGIRFAYRRFGKSDGVPIQFNMHFTGTMDHWDPAVTDGFAKDREVILFNNAGISSSSGEVPALIDEMATKALGLTQVDVLGFSLGGLVAQDLTLAEPRLVRRLVLVGTRPRCGEGMSWLTPEAQKIFGATYDEPDHLWLNVFFTPSERSQAAGREYLKRVRLCTRDRNSEVSDKVAPAQIEALATWGVPRENPSDYLKALQQPTMVVNGGADVIIYSANSFIPQQHVPNAQLVPYPDANHGSPYQYPELFVRHVSMVPLGQERAA